MQFLPHKKHTALHYKDRKADVEQWENSSRLQVP